MQYFQHFPKTIYGFDGDFKPAVDITVRTKIKQYVLDNINFYDKYEVKDGETLDIIADKVYGDPHLYWIIAIANNIMDPKFDIPLPETVFDDLVDRKYTNTTADHHWLDPDGEQVSEFTFIETYPGYWNYIPTPEAQAVSNYDYELEENDKKRWIKIIKKDMLPDLLNEVEALLGSYIKK